jgi:ribosomal-protein-alanine N-acetyltransferase
LLEGKTVNLRIMEKEDLSSVAEWRNNSDFWGEYNPLMQTSKADIQKVYDSLPAEEGWFLIETKDGNKVGTMSHKPEGRAQQIGYSILPSERKKGYCSEAVKIMVDYLFLSKDIGRVQACVDVRNDVSEKVLERAGFQKEGVIRKRAFFYGKWRDMTIYSILREEWKEPKILTKT